jgi:hypothetical protein
MTIKLKSIDLSLVTKIRPILIMDSPISVTLSKYQHSFLVVSNGFFCFSSDPRLASWIAHLIVSLLNTTFKCSLKAFLASPTLSSPPIVMALAQAHFWAKVMFFRHPPLEGPAWRTHSLQILVHVDWEIPNNFDTSCLLWTVILTKLGNKEG